MIVLILRYLSTMLINREYKQLHFTIYGSTGDYGRMIWYKATNKEDEGKITELPYGWEEHNQIIRSIK